MPVPEAQRRVVESLFRAMQAGPQGEKEMMALFADDATFVEPFTGQVQTHTGRDAIREAFAQMWRSPAPDLTLTLDRVDLDGNRVRADWTCTSSVFSTPMQGYDLFTIDKGRITKLEIVVTQMPPMSA